jgi:hypothetical protein
MLLPKTLGTWMFLIFKQWEKKCSKKCSLTCECCDCGQGQRRVARWRKQKVTKFSITWNCNVHWWFEEFKLKLVCWF